MVHIFFMDGIFKTQKLPGGMLFVKSCNRIFMTRYLYTRIPDIYYMNDDYTNIIKVCEDYIEFDTEQVENAKSTERQETSFPNE